MWGSSFTPNFSGKGEGGELTLSQELWVLLNEGKNIIESNPEPESKRVENIFVKDNKLKIKHEV
jgi:hypothetical protein